MSERRISGSFRDPSGFVFVRDGTLYRQVNRSYEPNYRKLMESGLYEELTGKGLLIPHTEAETDPAELLTAFKILKPEPISFISYPYEWSFAQLKDAALLTLRIQATALSYGMSLKDSSAYNIQFHQGRPVLIDSLSLEWHEEGEPWVAYRQFCQHFLAPLALAAFTEVHLSRLSQTYLDGIPLDHASRLLPFRSRLRLSLLTHIHLHARTQKHFEGKTVSTRRRISRTGLVGIIDHLRSAVRRLEWKPGKTVWASYYQETNYSQQALEHKKRIVEGFLDRTAPSGVWDLGANTGLFSRIASKKGIPTVAFDSDPAAVQANYLNCREEGERNLLPLLMDLTNPSPSIGWLHQERLSFLDRAPIDTALALALVHHLAISNNVPITGIAHFFSLLCKVLIIEFVPKQDFQVQRMLAMRKDVFEGYNQKTFEEEFERRFSILESVPIRDSERILYLMRKKEPG